EYVISRRFNSPRSYPFAPYRLQLHEGIDFAPKKPTKEALPVRASQRGIVNKVGFDKRGYGNYVRIAHTWGTANFVTWYGHLAEATVKENQYVNAGDVIGIAGSTGNSTGIHMHLTLQSIGRGLKNYVVADVVDPEPYLTSTINAFDEAWWVGDVTISDGWKLNGGQPFRKIWRIRNAGTTTWNAGYQLAFFRDQRMSGPASVELPPAAPGQVVDVAVDLVSPMTAGTYRSTWKPMNASKAYFDYPLYTEINVKSSAASGISEAHYVEDVTIPHDTDMKPGQSFRKVWRIRNTGTVEWGEGYEFAFISDNQMSGPDAIPLPPTKPGEEASISVDLVAPMEPGKAVGTWQPRDSDGNVFDFPMRVEITVLPSGQIDNAAFQSDVAVLQPGQTYVKTWRIRNVGQTRWTEDYHFVFLGGDALGAATTVAVPPTKPGALADISVLFTAPAQPGVYQSQWELRNPDGAGFGPVYSAEIEVMEGE
ncbi:MAG: peptidoglycan DD-metalloendopeptidase family protein, partial [Anaerolineae bacterium]|nr:peptidoglycan DD-metalloendopeptidase family protein [Anaerolineae bacterium]